MSYNTWHDYGYGIKVDDIGEVPPEKIRALIHMAPELEKDIDQWLSENDIADPTAEDYFESIIDDESGKLAALMKQVIQEAEDIELLSCDDFDGYRYLIYSSSYPWATSESAHKMTKERLEEIFTKYTKILTDKAIDVDYQSVANGG